MKVGAGHTHGKTRVWRPHLTAAQYIRKCGLAPAVASDNGISEEQFQYYF